VWSLCVLRLLPDASTFENPRLRTNVMTDRKRTISPFCSASLKKGSEDGKEDA